MKYRRRRGTRGARGVEDVVCVVCIATSFVHVVWTSSGNDSVCVQQAYGAAHAEEEQKATRSAANKWLDASQRCCGVNARGWRWNRLCIQSFFFTCALILHIEASCWSIVRSLKWVANSCFRSNFHCSRMVLFHAWDELAHSNWEWNPLTVLVRVWHHEDGILTFVTWKILWKTKAKNHANELTISINTMSSTWFRDVRTCFYTHCVRD